MRKLLGFATLMLLMHSQASFACGHCVEDKVAAVYDHAVVTRALGMKQQILFFAIDGRLADTASEKLALERVAVTVYGVAAGSARVSTQAASLSVAVDPRLANVAAVERSLQMKLAPRGLSLLFLRVMDKPAELRTLARP